MTPCGRTKVVLCLPVGGGRAGGPGKHMPGQSRALSARAFHYGVNGAPGLERGKETTLGPNGVKLRSQRGLFTQVVTQNSSSGAWVGLADP